MLLLPGVPTLSTKMVAPHLLKIRSTQPHGFQPQITFSAYFSLLNGKIIYDELSQTTNSAATSHLLTPLTQPMDVLFYVSRNLQVTNPISNIRGLVSLHDIRA